MENENWPSVRIPLSVFKHCPKCGENITDDPPYLKLQDHIQNCLNLSCEYEASKSSKKCSNCQRFFANETSLQKHRFFCDPSPTLADFVVKHEIKDEQTTTKESKKRKVKHVKVPCPVCQKLYYKTYLSNHMNIHTGNRPYQCKFCTQAFKDPTGLRTHEEAHENIRNYSCDLCDKSYRRQEDLSKHVLKHKGLKANICSFCAKTFTTLGSLKNHERNFHAKDGDEKKSTSAFSCSDCNGMEFKSRSSLRDHQIRNHGRKGEIFKCQHKGCKKDFTNPALLKIHARTHTNERPFACPYCSCSFKVKYHMESHAKRHTKIPNSFLCLECGHSFGDPQSLLQHGLNHEDLGQDSEAKETMKKHVFACGKCGLIFTKEEALNEHFKTHQNETVEEIIHVSTNDAENLQIVQGLNIKVESLEEFAANIK